jgi:hypothetical protein
MVIVAAETAAPPVATAPQTKFLLLPSTSGSDMIPLWFLVGDHVASQKSSQPVGRSLPEEGRPDCTGIERGNGCSAW